MASRYWQRRMPRRYSRRRFLQATGVGAAAAALGSWTAACGNDDDGNGEGPIRLGYLTSLSGAATPYTIPERDAIRLAVDEINENGGILGREVSLVERDDEATADGGTRQARDLIENQNVFLIFGVINSAIALAVSEVARETQVPFVDTIAQTAALTEEQGHRYVFRTATTHTGVAGRAMAIEAAVHEDWRRWYMIGPDYEYGHRVVEDFWEHFQQLRPDAERLGNQWPRFGLGEYSAQITAIMADRPDAVFTSLWGEDLISFIRQARGFGYFDDIQHTGWANVDPDVSVALGEDYPTGVFTGSNLSLQALADEPEMARFIEAYRERTSSLPTNGSGLGYTSMYLIKQALERAGELDREAFIDAFEGLSYESIYGNITMRACDHQAYGPVFVGWAEPVPDEPYYGLVNPTILTPDEYPELAQPCERIEELRS
jgi:branched-chain amino acid transport system substrate-binding protein